MNTENKNRTICFTFTLGDVTYAVDVKSVKEVLVYESITPVPRSVEYMKGVMNIRGSVIPVIDFRILFGIPVAQNGKNTSIIVTEVIAEDDAPLAFGFIADAVEGVSELDGEFLQDLADSGQGAIQNRFVKKIGRNGDHFILMLDMDEILRHVEHDIESYAAR
ncbi:MAG: chemotaxis protein CheW [Bacteroides sp.]|nr:chemotaxis protein CheW [Prevotella sp.]MCM1406994.1 chemotaxis protein CheW [Treponema brennaborense]MCM1470145.1 chemotaxis protein CheW [Bacteroides sp.]